MGLLVSPILCVEFALTYASSLAVHVVSALHSFEHDPCSPHPSCFILHPSVITAGGDGLDTLSLCRQCEQVVSDQDSPHISTVRTALPFSSRFNIQCAFPTQLQLPRSSLGQTPHKRSHDLHNTSALLHPLHIRHPLHFPLGKLLHARLRHHLEQRCLDKHLIRELWRDREDGTIQVSRSASKTGYKPIRTTHRYHRNTADYQVRSREVTKGDADVGRKRCVLLSCCHCRYFYPCML
jgi:hypothetical protein